MRKTMEWVGGWVGFFLLPAVLLIWLSTTKPFAWSLHAYGGAIVTVCGNNGFCGGVLGLLLPPVVLYWILRETVFRHDQEAAIFTVIFGFVLVVLAVGLSQG